MGARRTVSIFSISGRRLVVYTWPVEPRVQSSVRCETPEASTDGEVYHFKSFRATPKLRNTP